MKFIVIFLLIFSTLQADRDGGPYLGLGIGISQVDTDGLYNDMLDDTAKGITLYAGAYINKHLSVEVGYTSLDSWGLDEGYKVVEGDNISGSATSVSSLAHYAFFDDVLDFYAKFGVAELSFNFVSDNGFSMLYGAGVGYRFNDVFSAKIAYDKYIFNYDSTDGLKTTYRMQLEHLFFAVEMQF